LYHFISLPAPPVLDVSTSAAVSISLPVVKSASDVKVNLLGRFKKEGKTNKRNPPEEKRTQPGRVAKKPRIGK